MNDLLQFVMIDIRILDVFDILIVAYLMYRIYKVLRGSLAFNIFIGVALLYLVYYLVDALEMNLLSLLLGKFVGFGVLILIIIFQPEIRKFLLALGKSTLKGRVNLLNKWFNISTETNEVKKEIFVSMLASSLAEMSKTKTGVLIVLDFDQNLDQFIITGTKLNAKVSQQLLLNLFFKNSPLHDGAVIMNYDQISAASCILPITNRTDLPANLGLRHRAAIGVTEQNSVTALVVSEETGLMSLAQNGEIYHAKNKEAFIHLLNKYV